MPDQPSVPPLSAEEEQQIRAQEGWELNFVDDLVPRLLATLDAERTLRAQTEQQLAEIEACADAHMSAMEEQLAAKDAQLAEALDALTEARPYVLSQSRAEHMLDGFGPRSVQPSDRSLELVDKILSGYSRLRSARPTPEPTLREALESIANNSCCGPCQEAKLVAKAALAAVSPPPQAEGQSLITCDCRSLTVVPPPQERREP